MQLMALLHTLIKNELALVHKSRLANLITACDIATKSHRLFLTGLGRELHNQNKVSSNIQKIDRLLGNTHLQEERDLFYKAMIGQVVTADKRPWVHVDWSCINATTNLYLLRASLSLSGRSLVLYEKCYPKKKENNHTVHKAFLNQLKKLLPAFTRPIIVTDAGFRAPWFKHIVKLGWDFVGRLRNKNLVLLDNESIWQLSSTFFKHATSKPLYLGHGKLTEKHQLPLHLITYRKKSKQRHKLNKSKKISHSGNSKRYSKAHKEPWVLVTSLPWEGDLAKRVVNIYRQRMRIEENIRDTKCPYYGLGLEKSLSRSKERMDILLLIAAIATFAAWLSGLFTTLQGKWPDFQTHSAKMTRVLSKVYLGREALKKGVSLTVEQFHLILDALRQLNLATQLESIS
jgi:Transposase DDE domain